jgi:NADPH2:quinone reductase
MKAMIIKEFGIPEVFEPAEVMKPAIQSGHVLIRVHATSVNPFDCRMRQGLLPLMAPELPAVLHGDVAGVIEAVADDVTEFKIHDEVYGFSGGIKGHGGALAEYMLADARSIAHKPAALTMEEVAALPVAGITAWHGLIERLNLREPCQELLIQGAAGGVGHIAVQLAHWLGIKTYATVSSKEKAQYVESFGATAIDYHQKTVDDYLQQYTQGKGFAHVFDTVGYDNIPNAFKAATLGGKVATIAARTSCDLNLFHNKSLSFYGIAMFLPLTSGQFFDKQRYALNNLARLADLGKIKPRLDKIYSLSEVAKAHAHVESGKTFGKVVVKLV